MAFSTTDLDAINSAIASGEMTVKFNGREVTYRSLGELREAKRIIEQDLASRQAGGRPGGSYRFTFQTGRGE